MDKLACRTRSRGFRRREQHRAPRGITLVEVLLSIMLLTMGVFALLSVFTSSIDMMARARRQTLTAAHAQRRLDSLAALPCARLNATPRPSGTAQAPFLDGLRDSWTVTGSSDAPVITVSITTPDATAPVVYTTVVPCR